VDGAWTVREGGGYEVRTQISLRAGRLSDDLRAILPDQLREAMRSLELSIDGRCSLDDASLVVGSGNSGKWTQFNGEVSFENASLDVGVPIRGMTGRLRATLDKPPGDAPPGYALDIDADTFSVLGAYLRTGRALVRSGERAGDVRLESASGECYGGRLAATAQIAAGEAPEAPRQLSADIRLAGVRFAPLLDALTARPGIEGPLPPDESRDDDQSRGLLDAGLSFGAVVGRPETRRGRGQIRISGGRIIAFPLVTQMIEVSNLQIPSNSRLDFARGVFYINGSDMVFEELAILSRAIEIVGVGSITWPSQALDFSFNSRSARPIPFLSALIQGIRDELITTRVSGVLGAPVVTLQQFPGSRRILGGASRAELPAETLDRRAVAAEARERRNLGGIQPVPPAPEEGQGEPRPSSPESPPISSNPGTNE
jgi:hypothetical protein